MPERSRDMPNAIRFHKSGGPEVLLSEPVPIGKPGPGEARVRHTAVGVNFVDIYIRTGRGLGTEAAGVVEDVGPGVDHIKAGDRVAYAGGPLGAYSEVRVIPADRLVALPQGISDQQAAAMMLKGLTVQYLIRQIHQIRSSSTPQRAG
jgi:NADPH:quinone reductase